MKTRVRKTAVLAAMLLAGALGGCEKSTSGDVRLDTPGTGAGNSATGATGGTATSPGTGTGVGNSTATTPGTSGAGAATPSPNPDAAGGGGAGKPDEKSKPVDKATPPPY